MIIDSAAIKKAVGELLAQTIDIPDGKNGVLVVVGNLEGAEIAVALKVKDNWHIEVTGKHSWKGVNEFGVMSKIDW